jgi:hypothetical protein
MGLLRAVPLAVVLLVGGPARAGEDGADAKPPDTQPPAPAPSPVDPSGPSLPEPAAPTGTSTEAGGADRPAEPFADVIDLMDVSPLPFLETPRAPRDPREAPVWPAAGTPGPGDPEFVRAFPEDEAPAAGQAGAPATPPAGSAARPLGPRAPQPGDPEFMRAWPSEPGEPADAPEQGVVAAASRAGMLAAAQAPRFVIGEGLDDATGEPAVSPVAPDAPKATTPELPRILTAAAPPKAGKAASRPKPARSDPKERLQEDLELIRKAQAEWRAQAEAEVEAEARRQAEADKNPKAEAEGDFVRTRDRRAAQALQALWDKPLGQLAGRVVDAETRQPIPARVRIVDASNVPAGATLPEAGFYCEGVFAVPVIAGNVKVEVSAGRFRSSFSRDVAVATGGATPLEVVLARPAGLRFAEEGWRLADLDWSARARRGERPVWLEERPRVSDAVLAARAEGLDIVGLSVPGPEPGETASPAEFLAELDRWPRQGLLVLAEFPGPQHSFCGTALGIGVRNWTGLPHYLGDPRKPLADCLEAFRQDGALAVFAELQGRRAVDPREALQGYFQRLVEQGFYLAQDRCARLYAPAELPYATVAGPAYDVLAFDGSETAEEIWFNLLNEGYPIPVIGAAGGSLEGGRLPFGQTFIKLEGPPAREGVVAACREGRSMVSFGPAVFAELVERGRGVGDRVPADGRAQTLRIRAYASLLPGAALDTVEILRNGTVLHTEKCSLGLTELRDFRFPFTENQNSWYAVRVTEHSMKKPGIARRAWTNPIYFDTAGRRFPEPAATRYRGALRRAGGTPLAGTVTVLEPGREDREVEIGRDGRFDIKLLAAGTLVFAAPGYEPVARKPFDDRRVQRALGAIHAERETNLRRQLTQRALFATWRLLLAELSSEVELQPLGKAAQPPQAAPGEQP